jgi:hypothetical protein
MALEGREWGSHRDAEGRMESVSVPAARTRHICRFRHQRSVFVLILGDCATRLQIIWTLINGLLQSIYQYQKFALF